MWTYEIVTPEGDIPTLTDLGPATVGPQDAHGGAFWVTFHKNYSLDFEGMRLVERVVGRRVRVVRTDESGRREECGGAVASVLSIHMDGAGFQSLA